MDTPLGDRIVVLGVTGSGKTTLSRELAAKFGHQHIELDALQWNANWQPTPLEQFRARISLALAEQDRWVVDGNYNAARDLVWPRADTVVWLDYSRRVTFPRLLRRSCGRIVGREELWAGNRETFRTQFFSRDSLFLWAWRSHAAYRRAYPGLLAEPQHAHLRIHRFGHPRQTDCWLEKLAAACSPRT